MDRKVILSADAACDLSPQLLEQTKTNLFYFGITVDGKFYSGGQDIDTKQLFDTYYRKKVLPKTSAVSVGDYMERFKAWVDQGYDVVHIGLSSGISASFQNCCLAAQEVGHVYPVDSKNLSTGFGLVVLEAADRIAAGMEASQIQRELTELTAKVNASFVLETLEFMAAGGRCSSATALGANLLNIKPCIEMKPDVGKMEVGRKYRGDMRKVLEKYTRDRLQNLDGIRMDKIFITHTCVNMEYVDIVQRIVDKMGFDRVYLTTAGTTIASHCGPNTLGVLFIEK